MIPMETQITFIHDYVHALHPGDADVGRRGGRVGTDKGLTPIGVSENALLDLGIV